MYFKIMLRKTNVTIVKDRRPSPCRVEGLRSAARASLVESVHFLYGRANVNGRRYASTLGFYLVWSQLPPHGCPTRD